MANTGMKIAPWTYVDPGEVDGASPRGKPEQQMLGLGPCLEHEITRGIEDALNDNGF
jgi:hypothetical protein